MPQSSKQQVMTLAIEDGEEHILNFETGLQHTQLPAALRAMRRIPQGAVSQARIEQVLVAAGIRVTHDEDGDTLAQLLGDEVNLLVTPERLFVRFIKLASISAFVPEHVKHAAVGQLNNDFDVVRFRLLDSDRVCVDYSMTYERGIAPVQLVQMLKGFTWAVKAAFTSDTAAELLR